MSQDAVSLGSLIHEDMVYFDVEAETWQDVVRILAGHAIEHGYAVEGYAEDVIEREELYPTGLPTDVMKVAIPHAMVQDHVKEAAIVAYRTKSVSASGASAQVDAPFSVA